MALVVLATPPLLACQEEIVAVLEGDLVPVDALTIEVTLPFDEFAKDLEGWSGYGRTYELTNDVLANDFGGSLDARVLTSWFPFPSAAQVRDTGGLVRTDTLLTFIGGRLVARFDTATSVFDEALEVGVGALSQEWDFVSSSWGMAVDSVGDRQEWSESGGGPVTPVATALWDPAFADSIVLELDSAGVALWADTAGARKGARLDVVSEGARLDLTDLRLYLETRPSVNPDTLVELEVATRARTFIYSPAPDAPDNEIRIGGVPAWRSVFTMDLPETLDGPESLCQQVQCPLPLDPASIVSAFLVLTTKEPQAGFQPTDTLLMDARPVLEPSRLPKSPLGTTLLQTLGVSLPHESFGPDVGTRVEVQLGPYIQALLSVSDASFEAPTTVALLSAFEPSSLSFAAFEGPDSPFPPELRLVLVLAEDILIR
ncbi:MAG: hypothetical protein PVJ76_16815 [Gemmatimonadota bacterium]|jgi:hypothetical protein